MKTIAKLLGVSVIVGALAVAQAQAQGGPRGRGGAGWGAGGQYGRMYDPKTVQTVTGEVVSVETFTPTNGMSSGVHLQLKTDAETISVHLGPNWYLDNQDVQIEAKDKIEVTGSKITFQGKPAIIAAQVKRGNEVLALRDENGFPRWAGWRRR
ncbi:MAG TPA: DNA-binding protein [Verrucomicrobia bacterium]|nr:DNA-binding protein [Verrucomicrobiota bacterium]